MSFERSVSILFCIAFLLLKKYGATTYWCNNSVFTMFRFTLEYKLILQSNSLLTELKIDNNGNSQFDFTTLLHTYFRVADIKETTISGFNNCSYVDKVTNTLNK